MRGKYPRVAAVRQAIVAAHEPEKTSTEIAREVGASRTYVHRTLQTLGLPFARENRLQSGKVKADILRAYSPIKTDLLSRAKRYLRRRGYIVHLASVLGERGGKYAVDSERLTPEQMIAFAQKRGMVT